MSIISAIDKQTVHRICSGQVVLDLAMAVKELVENSVDAGATAIEIKFKDSGVDGFEVIDNGSGIAPENYETLTLKHYTSKIERFEDLESVTTFGFRGEALSSLCSLCELVVTTATKEQAPRGVRLVYDTNGRLVSQTPVARSVGTTVHLAQLFHTLPVRQQEFKRNAKREYGKALSIIQQYGIISNNIKISATNQVGRVPQKAIATNGNKAVRDNILNLFGAKILTQIMPFEVALDPLLEQVPNDHNEESKGATGVIHGFISKPEFKCGRGSGDRQYFYINGRPCTLPKLAKAFNELYKSFVANEYPFVVADIRLAPNKYDVNVTPDKRTILLHDEQAMITHIVEDLREQLEPSRSTFVATPFSIPQSDQVDTSMSPPEPVPSSNGSESIHPTRTFRPIPRDTSPPIPRTHLGVSMPRTTPPPMPRSTSSHVPRSTPPPIPRPTTRSERPSFSSFVYSPRPESIGVRKRQDMSIQDFMSKRRKSSAEDASPRATEVTGDPMEMVDELAEDDEQPRSVDGHQTERIERMEEVDGVEGDITVDENGVTVVRVMQKEIMGIPGPWFTRDIEGTIDVQLQRLKVSLYAKEDASMPQINTYTLEEANLSNVDDDETAVAALRRVIKKTDFANMKVIGQFNHGFIITMLDDHDLFIVDQHASDEKYNFETLQLTSKVQGQRLIEPQTVELTAAEELVVMENQEIIRANGFDVEIDESKEPTQRIRVISQPMSNDIMFDKKDFGELVYALSESPGQMVRCSRARRIFASKACRKSVMIGDPLNTRKMCQIVRNMGDLEQPWNCPHGRPTMRHLCSITPRAANTRRRRPLEVKGSLFG
ncbi:hypothetical protein BJV82DRAFT_616341 [Fennellomyces sp. T-0311]|nr:hypothetical protein BJV82DRAFT_616341 [Fennellomyces sp. T-0311]